MDASLQLEHAARGDQTALRGLVEQWWRPMRRWALLRCGDPVVAEDAVQEALVRLVRHLPGFDRTRPFEPWLRSLVRNACRDELTRRGLRWEREGTAAVEAMDPVTDPGRRLDVRRAAGTVLERFAVLSPRQRELIDLVDLQGLAPTEAAERVGISAGAARNQLHTARRRLRAALVDHPDILPLLREA